MLAEIQFRKKKWSPWLDQSFRKLNHEQNFEVNEKYETKNTCSIFSNVLSFFSMIRLDEEMRREIKYAPAFSAARNLELMDISICLSYAINYRLN